MKKLGVGIVLAGMLLAGEAGADQYRVWGAGNTSCGTWVTNRRADSVPAYAEFYWVRGLSLIHI